MFHASKKTSDYFTCHQRGHCIGCLKGKMPIDIMMEDQDSEGGDGRRPSTASIDSLLEPRSPHIDPVSLKILFNFICACAR